MSRNTCGEGRYTVWIEKHEVGNDLVYLIGGGEKPHIGGMTICEPGKKSESLELSEHRDCVLTEMIAKAACEKYKTKTLAEHEEFKAHFWETNEIKKAQTTLELPHVKKWVEENRG